MFNIMVATEYVLPPPARQADIPAVASVTPFKELRRNKDRKKDDPKNRKKSTFKDLLKKEVEEEFGQMGCFFEKRV